MRTFFPLGLALILHAILLLGVLAMQRPTKPQAIGYQTVRAYTITPTAHIAKESTKPSVQTLIPHKQQPTSIPRPPQQTKATMHTQPPTPATRQHRTMKQLTRGEENRLLIHLHNRIQQVLHYPQQAYSMHLTGIVTVRFILYPTGTLAAAAVTHSSGSRMLDHAAIQAVLAINPVKKTSPWITKQHPFQVNISFKPR